MTKHIPIGKIKLNPANPRIIRDAEYQELVRSVAQFPKMLYKRGVVVDGQMMCLGGNQRWRSILDILKMPESDLRELTTNYPDAFTLWEILREKKAVPEQWIVDGSDFTEEEIRRFIIVDNLQKGEHDWDALANGWDGDELAEWGMHVPGWDDESTGGISKEAAHASLSERFIVPPFSVLDTRQGYWQDRKQNWRALIGDNGESREGALFKSKPNDPVSKKLKEISAGVSILDPVLAECVCHWFGIPGGSAFDCFAGDSVFGYVSAHMGQQFTGIELREDQAKLNTDRVAGMPARYICDDGQNVGEHIEAESQDLFFSCPPYFDLEVYSDLPNDASNQGEYSDFLKILENAFHGAIDCLKNNRFAVVVVGDIRDKKGFYRRFVDDIKNMFCERGVLLYNDLVLIESLATAGIRAAPQMVARKVVKCHQNVLVFYKGDPKEIKNNYPKIEIAETYGSEDLEL